MPDKDTKKNQQENTTPAVDASKKEQQTTGNAQPQTENTQQDNKAQPTPEEVQEMRQKEAALGKLARVSAPTYSASADGITNAAMKRQAMQEESAKITNAINDAYYSPINELTNRTSEMLAKRNALKEQDEVAQRRSAAFQMAAGISDGLAALGNLIGVSYGGSNIDMGTGSLTPLAQKIEAARLERKADIKSIDDRLEQYRNQLLQMQLAKGTAQAQAQEKKEERAYDASVRKAERAHKTSERREAQAWQSGEKALDRKTNAAIAAAKIQSTQATAAQNNAFKARLETYRQEQANARAALNASGRGKTGANAPAPVILKGDDGKWYSYDLTKAEKDAIDAVLIDVAAVDAANDTNVNMVYELYKNALSDTKIRMGSKQEIADLRNQLIQVSPTARAMVMRGKTGTLITQDNDEFASNRAR